MYDRLLNPEPPRHSIYLERDTRVAECRDCCCEISERGMRFESRWKFDLGAQLRVGFDYPVGDTCPCCRKTGVEGIVVACWPTGIGSYEITLLFLDALDSPGWRSPESLNS